MELITTQKKYSKKFDAILFALQVVWCENEELKIRLYDSYYTHVEKHNQLANSIKAFVHLMGVKFKSARHVTGIHKEPLKQRESRNLCGIHVFARAWMIATNQTDNAYDFNHSVVDEIHKYVKALVLSCNEQICYSLTKTEKENNDFFVGVPSVKQTVSQIVIM